MRPLLDDESGDPVGGDARLPARPRPRAARRCSPSGAARSRPSASSPRRPATCSPRRSASSRAAWTRGAPAPGGDLKAWIGTGAATRHRLRALRAGARPLRHPDADRHPAASPGARLRRAGRAAARRRRSRSGGRARTARGASCRYLHEHEWARSADDVLWRRSKLGLHLSADASAPWSPTGAQRTGRTRRRAPAQRATEQAWS